ncbi:ABC transporter ATP-binding protein [Heliorestis acidaminivorans]|uniref:ABC transporter ATP-binding protein n=1 Tax=Heliorestis acidaminivorans TaxID=553427 RepID=A0A6I0EQW1_9FIRM|nr:ABC transporter ATP-binding protein [Heliorestis acidaminivorans]KAB2951817.1 ABC transporter ATP-binding protein [Heliorestis acidaminivorans]
MDPIFRTEKLSRLYQMGEVTVPALVDATFEINLGELVVILGPSGSGKSTLLNLLGGLDSATSGHCYYRGQDLSSFNEKALTNYRRNAVGFIFQFYNLLPALTVRENVEMGATLVKTPLDIDEVLEHVGLAERASHFPAQLSGGEQQRVAIARAAAKNPDVLLCDEPTGALDLSIGRKVLDFLQKFNQEQGKTVFIITHNGAIAQMAHRVLVMGSGRIVENRINAQPCAAEEVTW